MLKCSYPWLSCPGACACVLCAGAVDEDGRGKSIWDVFSHTPHKVRWFSHSRRRGGGLLYVCDGLMCPVAYLGVVCGTSVQVENNQNGDVACDHYHR